MKSCAYDKVKRSTRVLVVSVNFPIKRVRKNVSSSCGVLNLSTLKSSGDGGHGSVSFRSLISVRRMPAAFSKVFSFSFLVLKANSSIRTPYSIFTNVLRHLWYFKSGNSFLTNVSANFSTFSFPFSSAAATMVRQDSNELNVCNVSSSCTELW